ncbi:flagellar motor protein MotB [Pseudoroseomonas cervicalis]
MAKRDKNQRTVIVVRREEGGGDGGHHGGAWKIAYADFVTAMMAFFLLMWLINATSDAQRVGLADYFAPTNVLSRGPSGAGEPFGGRTINSTNTLAGETPPAMGERPMSPLPWTREDRPEDEPDDPPAEPQPPRRFRASPEAPESQGAALAPPPGLQGPVGNATGSASGNVAGNVTGTPAHLSAALARLAALDAPAPLRPARRPRRRGHHPAGPGRAPPCPACWRHSRCRTAPG